MAEGRRRGEDPEDDRRDDALADDELHDDVDDVDEIDEEEEADDVEPATAGSRRTATKARLKSTAPAGRKSTKGKATERGGIFLRLINFFREVVAELRKVIWPTRKELLTYTAVVIVFVAIMVTIVALLDLGFAEIVLWVFGNETTPAEGGGA